MDLAGISARQSTTERHRRLASLLPSFPTFPDCSSDVFDDSFLRCAISNCIDLSASEDLPLPDVITHLTTIIQQTEFAIPAAIFPEEFQDFLHLALFDRSPDLLLALFPLLHAILDRVPELLSQETLTDTLIELSESENIVLRLEAMRLLMALLGGSVSGLECFGRFCRSFFENPAELPGFPEFALRCIQIDRNCSTLDVDLVFEFFTFLATHFQFRDPVLRIATILAESQRPRFLQLSSDTDLLMIDSIETTSPSLKIVYLRYLKSLFADFFPIDRTSLDFLSSKIAECWRAKVGDVSRLAWELTALLTNQNPVDSFVSAGCVDAALECFEGDHKAETKIAAAAVALRAITDFKDHPRAQSVAEMIAEIHQTSAEERI
jgi:hypothetical protein